MSIENINETVNEVEETETVNSEIENPTYVICEKCGCIIEEGGVEVYEANGNSHYLCDECCSEELGNHEIFYCDNCDCYYNWDAGEHDNNDTHICNDCYQSDYSRCDECGDIIRSDELYEAHTDCRRSIWVCESCIDDYSICDHCGDLISESYSVCDGNTTVCNECYNDYYYTCRECGDLIHRDDVLWSEDDEPYCESCYNSCCNEDVIYNYSYKPNPDFYECDDEDTNLYLGVELEVDNGNNTNSTAKEITEEMDDRIYCKHDGSLDDGFEIVSHPCTLRYHTEKMEWESIMAILKNNSFRSHDTSTCGLHVHVSRNFFGNTEDEQDLHIAKLIMLIDKFWAKVVTFSRRKSENLQRWANKNNLEIADKDLTDEILKKVKSEKNNGRYRAINLSNYYTIEFRIFRGTLKYETFLATLQFVETMCHYAKQIALPEIWRVNFEDVFQNTEYTELRNYLVSKGLITSSVPVSETEEV